MVLVNLLETGPRLRHCLLDFEFKRRTHQVQGAGGHTDDVQRGDQATERTSQIVFR